MTASAPLNSASPSKCSACPRPEMGRDWYRYAVCGIEPGPFNAAGGLIVNATTDRAVLSQGRPHRRAGMAGDRRARAQTIDCRSGACACARRAHHVAVFRDRRARGLRVSRRQARHDALAICRSRSRPASRASALSRICFYVDEGDVLTAAGSAAGIDLCLHVVQKGFRTGGRQQRRAASGGAAASRRRPGAIHSKAGGARAG